MRRLDSKNRIIRAVYVGAVGGAMLLVAACQQKMANQPYFRPLEETTFFGDGRSSRPLVDGTVTLNQLPPDHALLTGMTKKGREMKAKADKDSARPYNSVAEVKEFYTDTIPIKIGEAELHRGMERYTIYCAPCHGAMGDGHGKIVERGFLKPTSYHGENSRGINRYRLGVDVTQKDDPKAKKDGDIELSLRDAPVGYYFEVISKGFGGMADYSMQVSPGDRWKIIAYIRALQFSQAANLKDLPESVREAATKAVEHDAKATPTHGGH